jgi:hypothetical protein
MKAVVLAIAMVLPWFGFTSGFQHEPVCHQPHHTICVGVIHRDPVGVGPRR